MDRRKVVPVVVLLQLQQRTFISYAHFLRRVRFCVLILALRLRHETEWRVRPCGQSSEDVQMAIPFVLGFLLALTFLTQLQKRFAVTLRRLIPPSLTLTGDIAAIASLRASSSAFLRASSSARVFSNAASAAAAAAADANRSSAALRASPSARAFLNAASASAITFRAQINSAHARRAPCFHAALQTAH